MPLILNRNFPWAALSRRVSKEQKNRETYSPTVSTYRWWARRSHALIGALIDRGCQVLGSNIVISDPMAGGGTVAVEAARRGLTVHAQDINPWAAFGLQTTLRPVDPNLVEKAAKKLIERLTNASAKHYVTSDGEEIVTQLHVRRCACSNCDGVNFLFPTTLVALDRRITENPKTGWFGCSACGHVHQAGWPKGSDRCPECRHDIGQINFEARRIVRRHFKCSHCAGEINVNATSLQLGGWSRALTITSDGKTMRIRPPESGAKPKKVSAMASRMNTPIPKGGETAALVSGGFVSWMDLFPDRQMALIDEAFSALNVTAIPTAVRRRLLLAVAGFAEMAGYACRWDPKYRKVYEVTANHHYSRLLLSAETNPIARLGSGTIRRRLNSAIQAAKWFSGSEIATVTCGSSKKQPMRSRSVDLVITDPPYYDSIQYAELSRLFRSFAAGLGLPWSNDAESGEAVTSRSLGCTHDEYVRRLDGIFKETARTLKPSGRMLLTFHHGETKAWEAVAESLRKAKWRILSVAVVHSENEKDFAKNKRKAITVDAVFECARRKYAPRNRVVTVLGPKTVIARNVLAMGAAVASSVNGSASPLRLLYLDQVKRRRIRKVLIR